MHTCHMKTCTKILIFGSNRGNGVKGHLIHKFINKCHSTWALNIQIYIYKAITLVSELIHICMNETCQQKQF